MTEGDVLSVAIAAARKVAFACILYGSLTACTTPGPTGTWYGSLHKVPPVVETEPVHSRFDAADDPAIWINADDPAASLIVATDKQKGLLVYALDGTERQYLRLGHTNNVDLRTGCWGNRDLTLVAASSRYPSELVLLTLDHGSGLLQEQKRHKVDLKEPYGICLYQDGNAQPYVFLNSSDGALVHYSVDAEFGIRELRRAKLRTKPEGCVADDEEGVLYIGEEKRGIWRMSARPEDPVELRMFDAISNGHLEADVEGLALYKGPRKLLIASSQGDNSFAVYDVATSEHLVSFKIAGHERLDDVSDTDGVAVTSFNLPGFPEGILVVQDGYNTRPWEKQNFKIVSWRDVQGVIDQILNE
jgi:3-phytase